MSLVGLRDMSVIETPPKDRLAIQTVVAHFDEKLIQSAHRASSWSAAGRSTSSTTAWRRIYEIAAKLQELVPKARVDRGPRPDGRRRAGEGDARVSCATKPTCWWRPPSSRTASTFRSCNTIIINRADRHGLSELYQLRGRVGRSNRRAYAYLLIPAEPELTPIARRRLAALKEFSDLGAGFKIAALDLELRGAGNMLGGEQSGTHRRRRLRDVHRHARARRARAEGRRAVRRRSALSSIWASIIRIPADYIAEENQRLRMYKRAAGVETDKQLEDVTGN